MEKKRKKRRVFKTFWEAFWRPEMLILPGQVAFFLFLSLVPTITLIGYTCSYLNLSNDLTYNLLTNIFSSEVSNLITPVITSTDITPAFFITLGVGYFIASNGMSSIIVASNTIYGIQDSGFFKRRLKAMLMEVIIVFLMLFVLVVPLLSSQIVNIMRAINIGNYMTNMTEKVFEILNGPIAWIIIFLLIKLIYTLAPDRKINTHVNTGAIFTTICWIGTTGLYAYYINHFANYSIFYGALANIVILMLWIYFLSYFFVMGMAMNYREEIDETGFIDLKAIIAASTDNSAANTTKKDTVKEAMEKKFTKVKNNLDHKKESKKTKEKDSTKVEEDSTKSKDKKEQ